MLLPILLLLTLQVRNLGLESLNLSLPLDTLIYLAVLIKEDKRLLSGNPWAHIFPSLFDLLIIFLTLKPTLKMR